MHDDTCADAPVIIDDFKRTTTEYGRNALPLHRTRLSQGERQQCHIDDGEGDEQSLNCHNLPPEWSFHLCAIGCVRLRRARSLVRAIPKPSRHADGHRRSDAQRPVNPNEIMCHSTWSRRK
jgi:hypothetical protein